MKNSIRIFIVIAISMAGFSSAFAQNLSTNPVESIVVSQENPVVVDVIINDRPTESTDDTIDFYLKQDNSENLLFLVAAVYDAASTSFTLNNLVAQYPYVTVNNTNYSDIVIKTSKGQISSDTLQNFSFADLLNQPEPTSGPVASVNITDDGPQSLEVTIETSQPQPNATVDVYLKENNSESLQLVGDTPLESSSISINIEYLILEYPYAVDSNRTEFSDIVIKTTQGQTQSDTLQTFSFADLIDPNTIVSSGMVVDFPGWEIAEFKAINQNGISGYYPNIKSNGPLTRSLSEDLYLILRNDDTKVNVAIATYEASGGPEFSITWPPPCENNQTGDCGYPAESQLQQGSVYEIFLSEFEDGSIPIDYGETEDTSADLGAVPAPENLVSLTNVERVENHFSITGQLNNSVPLGLVFRARKEEDSIANELFLGVFDETPPGNFTFNQVPGVPLIIDDEAVYIIDSFYNDEIVGSYRYDPGGPGTTIDVTNPTNSNTNTGSSGPTIGTTDDVLRDGIVTDCGYDIGKNGKGRVCGFTDVIALISRIITYIIVLVIPIAAIVIAYAGFLFLTSGGNPAKKTAAKKAITSAIVGIIIILAAWLIVKTIVSALGVDTTENNLFFYLQ